MSGDPPKKKCSECKAYQPLSRYPGQGRQSICSECRNARSREDRARMRAAVLETLGGKCVCCGEDENVFLDLDHINNDGAKDRRRATWRSAFKEPDRFQILCRNCNWAKFAVKVCPHQKGD